MLCTDDCHPDDIEKEGHIDKIIKLGIEAGIDIFDLLSAASINPIEHYRLPVGCVRKGDAADFIIVDDLKNFKVLKSYIGGQTVFDADKGVSFSTTCTEDFKSLHELKINSSDLIIKMPKDKNFIKVIEAEDGSLLTKTSLWQPVLNGDRTVNPDIDSDILKIVVLNRYAKAKPAVAFIKNFGLKCGAIASSVAHDSHNIIAAGVDDNAITKAIEHVIQHGGGICAQDNNSFEILELPVAGLISNHDGEKASKKYQSLNKKATQMGCTLKAPFMTLSFMSLLVIPQIKLSDKGLFDGERFEFTGLFR
jgi:adenine deaminase